MNVINALPESVREPFLRRAVALMTMKDKHKIAVAALPAALAVAYLPHAVKVFAIGVERYPLGEPRRAPRDGREKPALVRRCEACHANALESFAPFAAAVLSAKVRACTGTAALCIALCAACATLFTFELRLVVFQDTVASIETEHRIDMYVYNCLPLACFLSDGNSHATAAAMPPFVLASCDQKALKSNPLASARLAWRYVAIRIIYTIVYLTGEGKTAAGAVRALVWGMGFSSTLSLFRLALKA